MGEFATLHVIRGKKTKIARIVLIKNKLSFCLVTSTRKMTIDENGEMI